MCEECINAHITKNDDHYYYIARKIGNNNYYTHCPKHKLEYKYFFTEHFMTGCNQCPSCIKGIISNGIDDEILVIPKEKGEFHLKQLKSIISEGVEYLDKYCKNIYDILIKSISKKQDLLQKAKKYMMISLLETEGYYFIIKWLLILPYHLLAVKSLHLSEILAIPI